jgi:hypothetical protein
MFPSGTMRSPTSTLILSILCTDKYLAMKTSIDSSSPTGYVEVVCDPHVVDKLLNIVITVVMALSQSHWASPEYIPIIPQAEVRVSNGKGYSLTVGKVWGFRTSWHISKSSVY